MAFFVEVEIEIEDEVEVEVEVERFINFLFNKFSFTNRPNP